MASPRTDPLVPFDYDRPHLSRLWWRVVRPVFRVFNRLYFSSIRYAGLENVPKEGPVVLAVNHPAVIDSPLIGAYLTRRRLFYSIAEEELYLDRFPFKLMAFLLTPLGAFPVDRRLDVDRQTAKYAVDRLGEGNMLILAPEGAPNGAGVCFPSAPALSCCPCWRGNDCCGRGSRPRSKSCRRPSSTARPRAHCAPSGRCDSGHALVSPSANPSPWRTSSLPARRSSRSWTR